MIDVEKGKLFIKMDSPNKDDSISDSGEPHAKRKKSIPIISSSTIQQAFPLDLVSHQMFSDINSSTLLKHK